MADAAPIHEAPATDGDGARPAPGVGSIAQAFQVWYRRQTVSLTPTGPIDTLRKDLTGAPALTLLTQLATSTVTASDQLLPLYVTPDDFVSERNNSGRITGLRFRNAPLGPNNHSVLSVLDAHLHGRAGFVLCGGGSTLFVDKVEIGTTRVYGRGDTRPRPPDLGLVERMLRAILTAAVAEDGTRWTANSLKNVSSLALNALARAKSTDDTELLGSVIDWVEARDVAGLRGYVEDAKRSSLNQLVHAVIAALVDSMTGDQIVASFHESTGDDVGKLRSWLVASGVPCLPYPTNNHRLSANGHALQPMSLRDVQAGHRVIMASHAPTRPQLQMAYAGDANVLAVPEGAVVSKSGKGSNPTRSTVTYNSLSRENALRLVEIRPPAAAAADAPVADAPAAGVEALPALV